MSRKVIITVAPKGSIPTRKDNPNLPITVEEVAAETKRSYDVGASLIHLHARNPDTGRPSSDINLPGQTCGHKGCMSNHQQDHHRRRGHRPWPEPGGTVEAGGRTAARFRILECRLHEFREDPLFHTPDTIELYAKRTGELGVMPEFEAYDLSMIQNVDYWIREAGILEPLYQLSFVMGVMGGIPLTFKNLLAMK